MDGVEQLRGARTKLQRAEEHFGQLMAEHERFIRDRNPYRMLPENDPHPDFDTLWRVKIVEHPPLEKWSSITGECVHALRSALDHTAYALVQINRLGTDYAEFPIFKDKYVTNRATGAVLLDKTGKPRLRWQESAAKKLPGVGREPLPQMKWLQPYRRRDGDERFHALWVIHEMDVIDKHRRLNIVKPLVRDLTYHTTDCEIVNDEVLAGPFEDGTVIAHYRARPTRPNAKMHVQAEFLFDVLFGDGEPLQGEPVMQTLQGLLAYTGAVISRFDRFFA